MVLGDHTSGRSLPLDRRGALLGYLAYDGGWVDRDRLVLLFWPDSDEAGAKRNLRQLLYRTRQLTVDLRLEPDLEIAHDALRWQVDTDAKAFRAALAAGDGAAAIDHYRGPLLQGVQVDASSGFAAWLESERASLHAAFHSAGLQVADAATAQGRFDAAVDLLTRLHTIDPLAEDVVEAAMRALYLSGRRDAALDLYRDFAEELASELGLEPLTSTRALLEQISGSRALSFERPSGAPQRMQSRDLKPTTLFGRDRERAALLRATTPVVLVAGEPGIGKTALLSEVYPTALFTTAREGLERMPYHPFAALLRRRPELAAGSHLEDLARLVPDLAPGVTPPPTSPYETKVRLAEALAQVLAGEVAPLLVDDLQWADAATLECLVYLTGRGLTVIGAYRDQEAGPALTAALAGWRARGEVTVVRLEPIEEKAVRAVMADLMRSGEGPTLFSRRLWQRTGGNPMFLLETLRSLFDVGVLRSDDDGWHTAIDDITFDYSELDVPPRIMEVIGRRLEKLDGAALRVMEVLALAPTQLTAAALAKITGLSVPATAAAIDAAESGGFIADGRFRHDLLRESTAARLGQERRRVTHSLLARAYADETGEAADAGIVAEQWWLAGEVYSARREWLRQAAQLRTRGLHLAALDVLSDAVTRVPPSEDRRWLELGLAETTLEGGWLDRAAVLLDAVTPREEDAPELHAKLALVRATWLLNSGQVSEAATALDAERHWFSLIGDEDLRLDLVIFDARIATELHELTKAIELIEPEVKKLRAGRPSIRRAQFVTSLAALHDQLERHDEALTLHREALTVAKNIGSRYLEAEAHINLLFCLADLGRHDEAIEVGEGALKTTTYDNEPLIRINLAANYRQSGRFNEAIGHYRHLVDSGQPHLRTIALARWSEAAAQLGDHEEAIRLIDELLESLSLTDYPVALGAAAAVVHRLGSAEQVAAWRQHAPPLEPETLPTYLKAELDEVMERRAVDDLRGPP